MKTKRKELKQKIVSTLVIVAMILMIFTTLEYKRILADTVTMSQTVSAGSLSMSTVGSVSMNSAISIATATNSLGNLLVVNVIDYRGSGAGWTSSIYASNWNQITREAGTNNLSNAITYIAPGSLGNYNSSSETGIAVGSAGSLDAVVTLFNASSGNGMGAYFLGNSELNIVYSGDATLLDGTYQATSTVTVA
jgi:Flp pilus assembly protein TadG